MIATALTGRQHLISLIAESVATEIENEKPEPAVADNFNLLKRKNEINYLRPIQHRQATRIIDR